MSEDFIQQIQRLATEANAKLTAPHKHQIFVDVEQNKLRDFVSRLGNDAAIRHLSTISGLDLGQDIGIIYHFWRERDTVHVRTTVPKANPVAVSIVDIVPGAILYEMEVHDMFGVTFTGNPWIDKKLLLPDTWPQDLPPPLLKTSKPAEIRKRLQLEVEKE
mgnify:CR=1 FL=1